MIFAYNISLGRAHSEQIPPLGYLIKFVGFKEQPNNVECRLLHKTLEFHLAIELDAFAGLLPKSYF